MRCVCRRDPAATKPSLGVFRFSPSVRSMRAAGCFIAWAAALDGSSLLGQDSAGTAAAAATAPVRLRFAPYVAGIGQLSDPMSTAVGADDRIYVADTGHDQVRIFDPAGLPVAAWGAYGSRDGQFIAPRGVAIDGRTVYVVDAGNARIQVFDADGRYQRAWGGYGSGAGQLKFPHGIAASSDRVVVADTGNDRVQVFDVSGRLVRTIGRYGRGEGEFNRPTDVALDEHGNIYVADADNSRIQKFDAAGKFVLAWGDWGSFAGLMATPTSVDCHGGEVFVADSRNHRIQVFDAQGKFRYQWGVHAIRPREGKGKIHYPDHVAIAPSGLFAVVCESFENRCQIFRKTDVETAKKISKPWISPGDGGVASHYGRRLDVNGRLMVIAEPDAHAVSVFDTRRETPIEVTKFGVPGAKFGQFLVPTGLDVDEPSNSLFVNDSGNRRLQIFRLNRGRAADIKYDPFMARFVKSLDLGMPAAAWSVGDAGLEVGAVRRHANGDIYITDVRNARVLVFDASLKFLRAWGTFGEADGRFRRPTDLAFNRAGDLVYVVDEYSQRVQAFDADGGFAFAWGEYGTGEGEFIRPFGISAGVDGFVYVTDAGAHRVQKFDERGGFVMSWGQEGILPGQLYKPKGIAQDDRNRVIVLDFGNHRGVVFTPEGDYVSMFGARLFTHPRSLHAAQEKMR